MLKDKYLLTKLPTTDIFMREKRLVQPRGEAVYVIDGQTVKHITYFSLNTEDGFYRGGHYHKKKVENFYIICGKIKVQLKNLETNEQMGFVARTADKLTIRPNYAHIFKAIEFAQVIEYYGSC